MERAIRLLRELRGASSATERQVDRLLEVCRELKVPKITIFTIGGLEGWWEMNGAYLFTKRTDAHEFIWYYGHNGLTVYDREGGNPIPFEQWDPEADLFVRDSLYEGGTNMNPVERTRRDMVAA